MQKHCNDALIRYQFLSCHPPTGGWDGWQFTADPIDMHTDRSMQLYSCGVAQRTDGRRMTENEAKKAACVGFSSSSLRGVAAIFDGPWTSAQDRLSVGPNYG